MLATKNCKSKILATLICKNLNSLVSFDFNLVEFDRKIFRKARCSKVLVIIVLALIHSNLYLHPENADFSLLSKTSIIHFLIRQEFFNLPLETSPWIMQ